MTLSRDEVDRMRRLLRHAETTGLGPAEEAELRRLLARESPSSQHLSTSDLVTAGLVLLGLFGLLGLVN